MRKNATISEILQQLCTDLRAWRDTRRAGARIPVELWARAVEAARREGSYQTSRVLNLDYAELKRRLSESVAEAATDDSSVTFVELVRPVPRNIELCTLRVDAPSGGRLSVKLQNVSAESLSLIVREFRG